MPDNSPFNYYSWFTTIVKVICLQLNMSFNSNRTIAKAICLRCTISSTPGSDLLLVSASNSDAGAIHRSCSHKSWSSQTRWDANHFNKYKKLNWYAAHCHCGRCRDEVLHLKSNGIPAKGSIGIVCESAIGLMTKE